MKNITQRCCWLLVWFIQATHKKTAQIETKQAEKNRRPPYSGMYRQPLRLFSQ